MKTILSLFVVLLFVAGCGGGDGGDVMETHPPSDVSEGDGGQVPVLPEGDIPDKPFC